MGRRDGFLRVYSLTEVAERLSVSERTLRRMIADGRLSAIRIGAQWRITQAELERLMGAPWSRP